MEKSFSIIVSKVNDSIESVIFGKLGKLVGGMLHRDSPKWFKSCLLCINFFSQKRRISFSLHVRYTFADSQRAANVSVGWLWVRWGLTSSEPKFPFSPLFFISSTILLFLCLPICSYSH